MGNIQKAYVQADSMITIVCPECGYAKHVDITSFNSRRREFKIKCRCGYGFRLEVEYRKHARKEIDLPGMYNPRKKSLASGMAVKLCNISQGGVLIEFDQDHGLQEGEKGYISFILDNRKKSEISKQITVRSVNGQRVGCQFSEESAFDPQLGFYLME